VNLVDSSVLIAAFGRWHVRHADARAAIGRADAIPGHAALETYAVLTAMPPPRRAPGRLVLDFLMAHFPEQEGAGGGVRFACLAPEPATYRHVLEAVSSRGLIGGATFDALIAATARDADATLLTLDQRAAGTYQAVGSAIELL
jgi:predicted nucleic acid-binding protein